MIDYENLKPHELWLRREIRRIEMEEKMNETKKFTREELLNGYVPWLYPCEESERGFYVISREVVKKTRWFTDYKVIFCYGHPLKFYRLFFQLPPVEGHDCDPFHGSEPDCVEVFPVFYTKEELGK